MGLIKSASEILGGRPQPVDRDPRDRKGVGGRPPLHRKCSLPDCTRPHWGNGFCNPHNRAFMNWGDPLHVYKRGRRGEKCGCAAHSGNRKAESFL